MKDPTEENMSVSKREVAAHKLEDAWARNSTPRDKQLFFMIFGAIGLHFLSNFYIVDSDSNASIRPYSDFDDFYNSFYLKAHMNHTCRQLHFMSIAITLIMCLFDYTILPSGILAGLVGHATMKFTMHLETAFFEELSLFLVFIAFMGKLHCEGRPADGIKQALILITVIMALTRGSHILYEHNSANLHYPLWSLLGDFRMWKDITTRKLAMM